MGLGLLIHFRTFVFALVNGTWGNWTEWDTCNVTCGGGTQHRYRDCIGPFYGGFNCTGNGVDGQYCNTQNCPGTLYFLDNGIVYQSREIIVC